ncbi:MAG: hypothetical protein LBI18_09355 [Planctomycetaceae bacterium]|nr:hypothetical protein [Planctomycetaceae bacterium]
MFRSISLFCFIIFLLIIFCSGCKDDTIPATFESSQPASESLSAPPLLADPLQPRPAATVNGLTPRETKTELAISVSPETANTTAETTIESVNELAKTETILPESISTAPVLSETQSPSPFPVNDVFVQAATNQDSATTLSGFDLTTPDSPHSETPITNKTESVAITDEVKPADSTQPTSEEITATSLIPKESELEATPFVPESEPPQSSGVAKNAETSSETTPIVTEPFVPDSALDSVPVTPYPVNPLRQETETPTTDVVAKTNIETLTVESVTTNTETSATDNISKINNETTTENTVAQNNTEIPESNVIPLEAKQPFDPVTVNGELFADWAQPKLLLVFTGFMNGYVEPCGCAGLEQMKGGLSRRYTFFKELEEKKGWQVFPIDAGNLNKGFGRQEELKFNFVIDEALRLMKYQVTGIGNRELLLPTDTLILYCVDVPGIPRRYTSANVAIMQFDPDFTAPYRIFEQNGVKIGVTSVIGQSLLKDINNEDIQHDDAVKRLKEILPQFAAEKCDKRVLIIHGSAEETKRIVKSMPGQFDYVIPSDTPAEPPFRPNWIDNSMLIEVGEKGKFAVAVGLYDDPNTPFRYQRIPLDSRFENSKTITALMQLYQEQLQETGLQGLGIKPIPNRRAVEGGKFVGSKSCADCHELSFQVWRKSRHANAWRSLAETSKPSRTFDPECIACHTVGWSPVEFLPYEHGFLGEKETPQLLDVGCESCHGPGENHVKAEQNSNAALQEQHRKMIRLPLEANVAKKVCIQCHDGDNSPHFDFEIYWQKIIHKETE